MPDCQHTATPAEDERVLLEGLPEVGVGALDDCWAIIRAGATDCDECEDRRDTVLTEVAADAVRTAILFTVFQALLRLRLGSVTGTEMLLYDPATAGPVRTITERTVATWGESTPYPPDLIALTDTVFEDITAENRRACLDHLVGHAATAAKPVIRALADALNDGPVDFDGTAPWL